MPTSRRTLLAVLGGAALAAVAGGGYWAATRRPDAALEPWRLAGTYDDPRLNALSYAILAPNSHNLQSWLVDLDEPDAITLFANPDKLLPMTDPFARQITVSMGCFLEILRMALAEQGRGAVITPFPEGSEPGALDARPVARIEIRGAATPDPLFAEVTRRRTGKEPFDGARPVAPSTLESVIDAVETPSVASAFTLEADRVAALIDLAWRGHLREVETPRTLRESVEVMRIGRREIEANPDGIELGGVFLESLNLIGVLTRDGMMDPQSSAFAQGLELYRAIITSAQGFFWQITEDNRRESQIEAGRAWVRAQLRATALGLTLHPLSQTLQEYPEMTALFRDVYAALDAPLEAADAPDRVNPDRRTVQMFARVGYGPAVDPTPRWPASAKVL